MSSRRFLTIIITIAALLISLTIVAIVYAIISRESFQPEQIPEYTFLTQSATSATVHTTTTDNTTAADTTENSNPKEDNDHAITVKCGNDPLHSFTLTFDHSDIIVSGIYHGDTVTEITAGNDSVRPEISDDGNLSVRLTPESPDGNNWVIIKLTNGKPIYYRYSSQGGIPSPLVCEEPARKTEIAKRNIVEIPASITADYIFSGATEAERSEVLSTVKDIADMVCADITNDYDKARALAEWVSLNIYYDYSARDNSVTTETLSLERTLRLKRSVCGGYANLYAAMCQSQGIDCFVVTGTVVQNNLTFEDDFGSFPSHEWNMLTIGDRHIWIDTLWNTDNSFLRERYNAGPTYFRYFDISDEFMTHNHCADRIEHRVFFAD